MNIMQQKVYSFAIVARSMRPPVVHWERTIGGHIEQWINVLWHSIHLMKRL